MIDLLDILIWAGFFILGYLKGISSGKQIGENREHKTCNDCKYQDERYKGSFYKCSIHDGVFKCDFYCKYFDKRSNEDDWSSLENVREKVERGILDE